LALYEIAILGSPAATQKADLTREVDEIVKPFGLDPARDLQWPAVTRAFMPAQRIPSICVFFGALGASVDGLEAVLRAGIPILPIISGSGKVNTDIPANLQGFNCMNYDTDGVQRIASALMESIGLLPRQRRVFVSYRRQESRMAAIQLFDALSERLFDVFLDTHGIAPAEDFQATLWHRLCDSDVLVMLDTMTYFESRWTSAEYGRALAKGIAVLRVGWPSVSPSARVGTAATIQLASGDIDTTTERLTDDAISRICHQLEAVRSLGLAARHVNLLSGIRQAVERIGGEFEGMGLFKGLHLKLANNAKVVVYPTTGVPTSVTMHDAADHAKGKSVAVVYDHIGVHSRWITHLDWLGTQIPNVRWIKVAEAAWDLADWAQPK